MGIVRATRGRGIVVSSEARTVLGVRAPADVLNLMGVWGLSRERGAESVGINPRAVVVNEGMRRSAFRGVVDVVYGGESQVVAVPAKGKVKEKGKEKENSGVGKKGGKRKPVEEVSADGIPVISKRAAKRAKVLALQAEKEGEAAKTGSGDESSLQNSILSETGSQSAPASSSGIKAKANS